MVRGSKGLTPDAAALWASVSAEERRRVQRWNRLAIPTPGTPDLIDRAAYAATAASTMPSPFSAIPTAARSAEFSTPVYEIMPIFEDDQQSMEHYDRSQSGYSFAFDPGGHWRQLAGANNNDVDRTDFNRSFENEPAPITLVPTSTINPPRPRTVGAGYDPAERKLTVIFRDGTYYNYFEVSSREWQRFKQVRSKGQFILKYLNVKPRGVADINAIPGAAQQMAYRFARTGQIVQQGKQRKRTP